MWGNGRESAPPRRAVQGAPRHDVRNTDSLTAGHDGGRATAEHTLACLEARPDTVDPREHTAYLHCSHGTGAHLRWEPRGKSRNPINNIFVARSHAIDQ